jgi:multidrug efflux pump subunit AcrA (membrane-fusion protein)
MSIFPNPSPTPPEQPAQAAAPPPQAPPQQAGPLPLQYSTPATYYAPPPAPAAGGSGLKTGLLIGAVVLLAAANVYLYMQLDSVKKDLVKNNDAAQSRLDRLEQSSSVTARTNQQKVQELRDQLERARRQAALAAGDAKQEALKKVDETRAQLEAAQAQAAEAQKQLKSDISQVREQTDSANTKISQVGTEVTAVKGDVASTRSELEKTVADLKRATGELDGHSVLIATNAKELTALRTLGERNYVEFTVRKAKQPQKVGDVMILLKSADPKKNRYTIDLTADDKTTEKKDRGINEPVQFMTSKAGQPYELVVNDVKKDTIGGYLSVPKVQKSRN